MAYYIAYGCNVNREHMHMLCPTASLVGIGTLEDYELVFRGFGINVKMSLDPCKGKSVPVVIWQIDIDDEMTLDIHAEIPDKSERTNVTLAFREYEGGTERSEECYLYRMHSHLPMGRPQRAYVAICERGYADFGFTIDPLLDAVKRSVHQESAEMGYDRPEDYLFDLRIRL